MATFTRDWQEALPNDSSYANEIDTFITDFRGDVSDRLKDMVYGFTAGENDGIQGFKTIVFKQEAAAPGTPNTDEIVLYSIDDGTNCGLYAKNEDGYVKQILKKVGSTLALNIEDQDLTTALTVDGALTLNDVAVLTATANLDIGAYELRAATLESDIATGTAPLTVASTTKVDHLNADQVDGYDVAAYSGGQSHTVLGGFIIKHGVMSYSPSSACTVTFDTPFPNGVVTGHFTISHSAVMGGSMPVLSNLSTTQLTVTTSSGTATTIHWLAIGY